MNSYKRVWHTSSSKERIMTMLVMVLLLLSTGVNALSLYTRHVQYENNDCTGRIVFQQFVYTGRCQGSEYNGACQGLGTQSMCTADPDLAFDMPNWVVEARGGLVDAGEYPKYMKVTGFILGCFPMYNWEGGFIASVKMVCEPGEQRVYMYSDKECSRGLLSRKAYGVSSEFDAYERMPSTNMWSKVHCEAAR